LHEQLKIKAKGDGRFPKGDISIHLMNNNMTITESGLRTNRKLFLCMTTETAMAAANDDEDI